MTKIEKKFPIESWVQCNGKIGRVYKTSDDYVFTELGGDPSYQRYWKTEDCTPIQEPRPRKTRKVNWDECEKWLTENKVSGPHRNTEGEWWIQIRTMTYVSSTRIGCIIKARKGS